MITNFGYNKKTPKVSALGVLCFIVNLENYSLIILTVFSLPLLDSVTK